MAKKKKKVSPFSIKWNEHKKSGLQLDDFLLKVKKRDAALIE